MTSPAAAAAREANRSANGRFGETAKAEATPLDLTPGFDGGMSAEETAGWRVRGVPPDMAVQWYQAGFTAFTSAEWARAWFSAQDAALWKGWGFTVDQARDWRAGGFAPSSAAIWIENGFTPAAATQWLAAGNPHPPIPAAPASAGRDPGVAEAAESTLSWWADPNRQVPFSEHGEHLAPTDEPLTA